MAEVKLKKTTPNFGKKHHNLTLRGRIQVILEELLILDKAFQKKTQHAY